MATPNGSKAQRGAKSDVKAKVGLSRSGKKRRSRKAQSRSDDATTAKRSRRRRAYSKKNKARSEKARFAATSKKKIQAHVSSRGRRSQARRDAKG